MRIVVTRPQDDSERTAAALRQRGHIVVVAPLLRVEHLPLTLAHTYGAVVITSANAAAAIAGHPECAALTALPFPLGELPPASARLFHLALSLAEVAPHIELYGGDPKVPYSFDEARFVADHGRVAA